MEREETLSTHATPNLELALQTLETHGRGVTLGTRSVLNMHAMLVRLRESGVRLESYADLAGWLAPLLAVDATEQAHVHRVLAQLDGVSPSTAPKAGPVPAPTLPEPAARPKRRGVGAFSTLLGAAALVVALGLFALLVTYSEFGIDAPLPAPIEPDAEAGSGWVFSLNARLVDALSQITRERVVLGLISVFCIALWYQLVRFLFLRGDQRAALQTGAKQGGQRKNFVAASARGTLFDTSEERGLFRLFHLARDLPSRDIDVPATVDRAYPTAGRIMNLAFESKRASIGFLLLIERRSKRDHLAFMADTLADALQDEGVPCTVAGLTADARAAIVDGGPAVPLSRLGGQNGGDQKLVVSTLGRVLSTDRTKPAGWLSLLGDAEDTIVLLAQGEVSAGTDILRRKGHPVFALDDAGLEALTAHLQNRFGPGDDRHPNTRPRLKAQRQRASLPDHNLSVSAEALKTADFLRVKLTTDAYHLLSLLAIFPIVLPELTRYLGMGIRSERGHPLYATSTIAELAALPWLRNGSIPFELRKALLQDLPDEKYDAALALIQQFQDSDIAEGSGGFSILVDAQKKTAQLHNTLLADESVDDIVGDPLLLSFLQKDDLSKLTPQASGRLADLLRSAALRTKRNTYLLIAAATTVLAAALLFLWAAGGAPVLPGLEALNTLFVISNDAILYRSVHFYALAGLVGFWLVATLSLQIDHATTNAQASPVSRIARRTLSVYLYIIRGLALALLCVDTTRLLAPSTVNQVWYDSSFGYDTAPILTAIAVAALTFLPVNRPRIDVAATLVKSNPIPLAIGVFAIGFTTWSWLFIQAELSNYNTLSVAYSVVVSVALCTFGAGQLRRAVPRLFTARGSEPVPSTRSLSLRCLAVPISAFIAYEFLLQTNEIIPLNLASTFNMISFVLPPAALLVWARVSGPAIFLICLALAYAASQVAIDVPEIYVGFFLFFLCFAAGFVFQRPLLICATFLASTPFLLVGLWYVSSPGFAQLPTTWLYAVYSGVLIFPAAATALALIAARRWLILRAGDEPLWPSGSIIALIFLPLFPVLMVGWLPQGWSYSWWFGPLVYPLAAWLTYRYKLWGAAVSVIGCVPMIVMTGVAANIVVGWGSVGHYLLLIAIVSLIGVPRRFLRILGLTHVPNATLWCITILANITVGYQIPEIAFNINSTLNVPYALFLFLLGMSRVHLGAPIGIFIFVAAVGTIANMLLPLDWRDPGGPFVLFGPPNLLNIFFFPIIALLGRAARKAVDPFMPSDEGAILKWLRHSVENRNWIVFVILLGLAGTTFSITREATPLVTLSLSSIWLAFVTFLYGFQRMFFGLVLFAGTFVVSNVFSVFDLSSFQFETPTLTYTIDWVTGGLGASLFYLAAFALGYYVHQLTMGLRYSVMSVQYPEAAALWDKQPIIPTGDRFGTTIEDELRHTRRTSRWPLVVTSAPRDSTRFNEVLARTSTLMNVLNYPLNNEEAREKLGRQKEDIWIATSDFQERHPSHAKRRELALLRLFRGDAIPPGWRDTPTLPYPPVIWSLINRTSLADLLSALALAGLLAFGVTVAMSINA